MAISIRKFVAITMASSLPFASLQAGEIRNFNLEAQDADQGLQRLAVQGDFQVFYPTGVTEGRRIREVHGAYTPEAALELALRGSGLSCWVTVDGTYVIEPASNPNEGTTCRPLEAHADVGAMRLAQASQKNEEEIEEVVIRGVEFRYEEVMSANKMPMSAKDTPQSVKLITQDLIEFSGIRKFEDVYKVDASSASSNAGDQFPRNYYRGFATQGINAIKVDGFRVIGNIQLDLAPLERFEVVKGATSTLYGQNTVGGTLNAISKMPQKVFGGSFGFESGSFDHYRGDLDLYGPLTADGSLSYRFIGAYQDEGSFVDFAYDRRTVVAPTLKYEFDEDTSLMMRVNYQHYNFMPYFGFGAQFIGNDINDPAQLTTENFRIPRVPRSRSGNSPDNFAHKESLIANTVLDHHMGQWVLRGSLQYSHSRTNLSAMSTSRTYLDELTDTSIYHTERGESVYSGEVNLYGDVEILGRSHTLFFGADYAKLNNDLTYLFTNLAGSETGFSIFHPDYTLIPFPAHADGYQLSAPGRNDHRMSGVTAQAVLRPLDGLTVSLGTRYSHDILLGQSACCDVGAPLDPVDRLEANAFTYQAGSTYAVTHQLNLYAGYGTTFEPQSSFVAPNRRIDPQQGTSYEVGLKGDVPGHRLSYSLALFHMDRTNLAESVPGTPFVKPVGTQTAEGVEFDFQGEMAKGWEVYGSLALMDPEYTKGEFKGIQPANAPKRGVSLFTSYEIQDGQLRGLGVGGGVVYKSGRNTADIYGVKTPITFLGDFTEVSLRLFYSRMKWRFDLNVANLFNEKYYSTVDETLYWSYQSNAPLTVRGTVRYQF